MAEIRNSQSEKLRDFQYFINFRCSNEANTHIVQEKQQR